MTPRRQYRCVFLIISAALLGCSGSRPKIAPTFNESASLTGNLPANPLQWRVITSAMNRKDSTMSTLYGNDAAVDYARTNAEPKNYPDGSSLCLVTWTQAEDGRWFGAKIPAQAKSVEFVVVQINPQERPSYSYLEYEGSPLKIVSQEQSFVPNGRAAFLLSQRAAVMP